MKRFILAFIKHRTRKREMREWNKRMELCEKSSQPKTGGMFFDKQFPGILFLLGTCISMNGSSDSNYSFEYLQDQFRNLQVQLKARYPDFKLGRVVLEVEVYYAGLLLADEDFRNSLRLIIRTLRGLDDWDRVKVIVEGLETEFVIDNHPLTLRIATGSYYQGYGFFVEGHPGAEGRDGMWCRPTPDLLAAFTGEQTM